MKNISIFAALVGVAVFAFGTAKGDVTVSTVDQLVEAVNKGTDNNIKVMPGVYDLSTNADGTARSPAAWTADAATAYLISNSRSLRIYGANNKPWNEKTPAEESVIICTNAQARLFYCYGGTARGSVFSHLTFDGGRAIDSGTEDRKRCGGAIYFLNNGGGYATNCVFRNSTAVKGGALHAVGAYCCCFSNCTATSRGGGAYGSGEASYNNRTNEFVNCLFIDCKSGSTGGAIHSTNMQDYWKKNAGRISGCVFSNCTAQTGGAIYADRGCLIEGCEFVGNGSKTGAVSYNDSSGYAATDKGLISNCTFIANCQTNSSTGGGGAIGSWNTVVDSHFIGNRSVNQGGAVYNVTAIHCDFDGNASTNQGGAAVYGTYTDCYFTNNRAVNQRGGALHNARAIRCRFVDNYTTSNGRGGATDRSHCQNCYFTGVGDVSGGTMLNCEFDGVKMIKGVTPSHLFDAVANGLVHFAATNCLVHNCAVTYLGYCNGANMELVNCTFADNLLVNNGTPYSIYSAQSSNYIGGGMILPGTNRVINCIFSRNTYQDGGAACDLVSYLSTVDTDYGRSAIIISNSLYTAGYSGLDNAIAGNIYHASARFMSNRTGVTNYMTHVTSPARKHGLMLPNRIDDKDFVGNPRTTAGASGDTVDIGCMETIVKPDPMMILVR